MHRFINHYCRRLAATLVLLSGVFVGELAAVGAEVSSEPLLTRWSQSVSADSVLPEYPRPQLVRQDWLNLNGEWGFAITGINDETPTSFSEKILVPFPIESYLGGLQKSLSSSQRAWYQRKFQIAPDWNGKKVLLHFGAVDWHAEIWVNGIRAGEHRGGYDPFKLDITELLKPDGDNVVLVGVIDPTDSGSQPRGKQNISPEGIWYTPVSGIWQTVWLEPVPTMYIDRLKITPNYEDSTVSVVVDVEESTPHARVRLTVKSEGTVVASVEKKASEPMVLSIDDARSWSPDDPFLYDLDVEVIVDGKTIDQVTSYFGMRSIQLGLDRNGQTRILLNGEPIFQFGPLDQGYWPDGLYTAPSDEALRYDLEMIKQLGFNMVRKHVKVEPARWYNWCDRMGLLVWQDMPNGGDLAPWPMDGTELQSTPESAAQYREELKAMIDSISHFPSVVVWVPFNEGWGQFETKSVSTWLEEYDPTRLIVSASGGNDFGCGHINDDHFYPSPGAPPAERNRAAVLGEFGGLGLPVAGHTWQPKDNWGYRSFQTQEQFALAYEDVITKLRPLVESHLSAAVYTQITDVEIEINGLMTYDRKIMKVNQERVRSANARLFAPLPSKNHAERVAASVLAWWRFEEGVAGKLVSDISNRMGAIAAHDSSGRNNHLYAFAKQNAPSISDSVSRRSLGVVQTVNRLCLDDSLPIENGVSTRDLYTNPEVSRTHMDVVDRFPFSDWTIEASFCLSELSGEHVVLGKEESRSGVLSSLFQLGVFGTPSKIGVEIVDDSGKKTVVSSDVLVKKNKWQHVVVTCEDSLVKLYLASDDNRHRYSLVGEALLQGSLSQRRGTWVVGRGCESGSVGRDFHGWIDEIRISTKALKKSEFLFGESR